MSRTQRKSSYPEAPRWFHEFTTWFCDRLRNCLPPLALATFFENGCEQTNLIIRSSSLPSSSCHPSSTSSVVFRLAPLTCTFSSVVFQLAPSSPHPFSTVHHLPSPSLSCTVYRQYPSSIFNCPSSVVFTVSHHHQQSVSITFHLLPSVVPYFTCIRQHHSNQHSSPFTYPLSLLSAKRSWNLFTDPGRIVNFNFFSEWNWKSCSTAFLFLFLGQKN